MVSRKDPDQKGGGDVEMSKGKLNQNGVRKLWREGSHACAPQHHSSDPAGRNTFSDSEISYSLQSMENQNPPNFPLSSVQLLSHVRLFATPWTAAYQASLPITNFRRFLKVMSIELVRPSNHLTLCRPLLFLPSILPRIRVFSKWVSSSHQVPKYWSFSFSISPSNEYSGLISFRIEWFDLLEVQGTLKRLLQHHSSKALIPPKT